MDSRWTHPSWIYIKDLKNPVPSKKRKLDRRKWERNLKTTQTKSEIHGLTMDPPVLDQHGGPQESEENSMGEDEEEI